ncbi:response regulator [Lachnospiraceae bacterium ZAX-1]
MFKILVADDEKYIRKGIVSMLEGNLIQEIECIEASNGYEAIEKVKSETPNLIITDISMPGIDGLEFIRELNKRQTKAPVIILSGYENFEYAKQAIKLGVKEYLMKPIKKQEFVELIRSYITNIEESSKRNYEQYLKKKEQQIILERLKKDFLLGLLKCETREDAKNYLIQLKELGLRFESSLYECVVVSYKATKENFDYIDFVVKNIVDEYWSMEHIDDKVINVVYHKGMIVSIFEGNVSGIGQAQRKKQLTELIQLLKKYAKTDVFAGIGDIAHDATKLHISLRHALRAANCKIFEDGNSLCVYEELKEGNDIPKLELSKRMRPIEEMDVPFILAEYSGLIKHAHTQKLIRLMESEYEDMHSYLDLAITRRLTNAEEYQDKHQSFCDLWSMWEARKELKERIDIAKELSEDTGGVNEGLVRRMIEYISENVTEEIDLTTVAERFHKTPGYISTIFKKYTNQGFNTYLTGERMEIAKRLLEDSSISIGDVGKLCGYSNSKYFSVVFKKVTDMSPREYRDDKANS